MIAGRQACRPRHRHHLPAHPQAQPTTGACAACKPPLQLHTSDVSSPNFPVFLIYIQLIGRNIGLNVKSIVVLFVTETSYLKLQSGLQNNIRTRTAIDQSYFMVMLIQFLTTRQGRITSAIKIRDQSVTLMIASEEMENVNAPNLQ